MRSNPGVTATHKLAMMGYRFTVKGNIICVNYQGYGEPDPGQVKPLLAVVKEHKKDVINFLLIKPKAQERILTCYECDYFRPPSNSPNLEQAWGICRKQNKGRYGVATACEAILI